MSAQDTLSRGEALSLLSVTSGGVVAAALQAPTAEAQSRAAAPTRPQYIFGYGSLIERQSRTGTWPSAESASPVIVKGIARGWFDQPDVPSISPTLLGGIADAGAECNGVIFPVTQAELASYSQREVGYKPTAIAASQIARLDCTSSGPDGDIWYFANTQKRYASAARPMVQSYVDVCLTGCLEIETTYPLAKQANFAERFVRTTSNWGPPWINDRIYPWRPF